MTQYIKELIEHRFHGDVLAFRCYCLKYKVIPKEETKDFSYKYYLWRVPMKDRKGLAKRLILMSR